MYRAAPWAVAVKAPILLALACLSISTAQAADEVLTLACQSTARSQGVRLDGPNLIDEPSSMSLIVNFTARTVTGFEYGYVRYEIPPVAITSVNDLTVKFVGSRIFGFAAETLTGTLDRVTDDVHATWTFGTATRTLSLKCKPTERMF